MFTSIRHLLIALFLLPLGAQAQNMEAQKECVETVANAATDSVDLAATVELFQKFGPVCENNVEFRQWSNEALFGILQNKPLLVIKSLRRESVNQSLILDELRHPLLDYQYEELQARVADLPQSAERDSILAALQFAASKEH